MKRFVLGVWASFVTFLSLGQSVAWCDQKIQTTFPRGINSELSVAVIAGDRGGLALKDTELIRNGLFGAGIIVNQVSSSVEVLDSNNLTMVLSAVTESNVDIAAIVSSSSAGVNTTFYLAEDGTMIGRVSRPGIPYFGSESKVNSKLQTCYTMAFAHHVRN